LRIKANNRPGVTRYDCDDSILNWPSPSEKFDLIVASPPLGMRFGNKYKETEPGFKSAERFLIEKGVPSLYAKGKLIAIMSVGFLFRGGHDQKLRKNLIEQDLIDTIIALPGGLLQNTGIPLIILVLNKHKKLKGHVRLIDAENFIETRGPKEKTLNDYKLNGVIQGNNKNKESIRIVTNDQIREQDYNLNIPLYFKEELEGVMLSEMLELVRGTKNDLPEVGKYIRIRDLKDDKLDYQLELGNINETKLPKGNIVSIDKSSLLLAIRWKSLKPTFFKFEGEHFYKSQDILSFKVNEDVVDIGYLINELHSEYVLKQVESYRMGGTIPYLRKDDLLKIKIKIPPLAEQRAKVQGLFELSDKIKILQQERNELAHGELVKKFSEFASLKHTLGRPRQNILDWSDNLLHFLNDKREAFDPLNKAFEAFYEIDIISALNEIKQDVNFITDVLEKGENGFVIEEFEKQIISLADINKIIKGLSSNNYNFKIKNLLIKGDELKKRGIYGNRTLLRTLLDNLLSNASKYGFEKKEPGNEVVFELTVVDDVLIMEVRNNGKPFLKNYDREKFITKYSTADTNLGTGMGGYDINRIATDFENPEWELALNEDPLYPVKFKFQFPIKLIN